MPSGVGKATDRVAAAKAVKAGAPRHCGPGVSKMSIDRTVTLMAPAPAPAGSKGTFVN